MHPADEAIIKSRIGDHTSSSVRRQVALHRVKDLFSAISDNKGMTPNLALRICKDEVMNIFTWPSAKRQFRHERNRADGRMAKYNEFLLGFLNKDYDQLGSTPWTKCNYRGGVYYMNRSSNDYYVVSAHSTSKAAEEARSSLPGASTYTFEFKGIAIILVYRSRRHIETA